MMHARKLPRISEPSFDRDYYDNGGHLKHVNSTSYENKFQSNRIINTKNYCSSYVRRSTSPEETSTKSSANKLNLSSSLRNSRKDRERESYKYATRKERDRGGGDDRSLDARRYRIGEKIVCGSGGDSMELKQVRNSGDWSEHQSSSGKRYYYNCRTEVSQWEKPRDWYLPSSERERRSYFPSANSTGRALVNNEIPGKYIHSTHCDRSSSSSTSLSSPSNSRGDRTHMSVVSRRNNTLVNNSHEGGSTQYYNQPVCSDTRYVDGSSIGNSRKRCNISAGSQMIDMDISSPSLETLPLDYDDRDASVCRNSIQTFNSSCVPPPSKIIKTIQSTSSFGSPTSRNNLPSSSPYHRDVIGTPNRQSEFTDLGADNHGSKSVYSLQTPSSHISLSPSLANYYRESLISHIQGWPAEVIERACGRLSEENNALGGLGVTRVSADLKMARSLVRLAEIQATLHEQRVLFLRQQISDFECMSHPNSAVIGSELSCANK